MTTSLLIKNGYIVTMDEKNTRISNGAIFVEDNEIKFVDKTKNVEKLLTTHHLQLTKIIDATNCIVLPGFVNTHHHLYQTVNRVIPEVQNAGLFNWIKFLYELWRKITPEWIEISTRVGIAELLLTGCTTTLDQFYIFPNNQPKDLIDYEMKSAKDLGIRFQIARGAMSKGKSQGGLPPDDLVQPEDEILKDYERVINKFHDDKKFSMNRISLAPCSPFSVTEKLLKETAEFARKKKVLLHTHIAETKDEEDYCLSTYNMRPVEFMESIGWLGEDVSFAHCVHLSQQEIELLGKTKTGMCHCPTSNLRLGSGIAPVRNLLDSGAKISLAVDGSASNDSSNMLQEIKQCLLVGRYKSGVEMFSAEDALRIATCGGAEVLNRNDIGSIEPGKAADIAVFDLNKIGYAGSAEIDPVASLVFCGDSQIAKTVIVNGKVVVDDNKLLTADESEIIEKANKLTKKILELSFLIIFLLSNLLHPLLPLLSAQKPIEPVQISTPLATPPSAQLELQESTITTITELQKSTIPVEVHIDTRTAIEKLLDTDVGIRREALQTIIAERNKKNIPHLLKLLKDKDREIRRLSVQGVVDSGATGEDVGPELVKLLKTEKDISVKIAIMNSLGRLKYKPAVDIISEFLNHEFPILRTYAVNTLAEISDPKTFPKIVDKIKDTAEGVCVEAMRAAVKCKIYSALPEIIKRFAHPISIVRKEAAIAAGELGNKSVKLELKKLLTDEDKSVVEAAKNAIEKVSRKK